MANGQNSISLFKENMQFGWQFVTDAVVDQVTCIKSITRLNSLLGETSPFCVGFLDGTVEYRSVPTLQRVDLKDVLFPSMLKSVKTDGSINLDVKAKNFGSDGTENLFESEFFKGTKVENDLFNNAQEKSNRLDIDTKTDNIVGQRFPNLIPVCISSSPNGMYTMCLCVNAEGDSNRATIVVDSIYTEKAIIPEKRDQFYARAATILVTSFKKMFCMHDIVTFLKSLNEPIEFSQSLFNSVLSIQEKNFGIKNATSLNSGKSTDEQILMLQFFISRYAIQLQFLIV
ncbi:hypothetical protein BC833DRAFT_579670 [Globomyces pollinis-pini]|nr:hypothetical protein BC833DRAFT_579670 [Globomyces pollinis-pini]